MIPDLKEVKAAAERLAPFVNRTPVFTSRSLDSISGARLHFKCENFQRAGAFKFRGASNAIMQLSGEQGSKGVITHSSGNFAGALALAGSEQNIAVTVVMPANAPDAKRKATAAYGAHIIESGNKPLDREELMEEEQKRSGARFIHPSNDPDVILGNASAAWELIKETGTLDAVIAPVGGGGLLAGTALASSLLLSEVDIYGAEPFGADDAWHSFNTGRIHPSTNPQTIADGLKTCLGDKNFPIIRSMVSDIIRVEEKEIIEAMRLVWERMKILIEPSSAVAVAALLREDKLFRNKKIGIILSGGNVDITNLPF